MPKEKDKGLIGGIPDLLSIVLILTVALWTGVGWYEGDDPQRRDGILLAVLLMRRWK